MGIFVPEAKIPSGFTLSNVYMSFYQQPMYIFPYGSNLCKVNASYKIWVNESKTPDTNMKFPLSLNSAPIDNLFPTLYTQLKQMYPGATDVLLENQTSPTSNI